MVAPTFVKHFDVIDDILPGSRSAHYTFVLINLYLFHCSILSKIYHRLHELYKVIPPAVNAEVKARFAISFAINIIAALNAMATFRANIGIYAAEDII